MKQHEDYHYSVTIKTDDLAVLHCLRGLTHYAQQTGKRMIAWGGTKKEDWERNNHCVTFHFSKPEYRSTFVDEAGRLLPRELWRIIRTDDADPATPQQH